MTGLLTKWMPQSMLILNPPKNPGYRAYLLNARIPSPLIYPLPGLINSNSCSNLLHISLSTAWSTLTGIYFELLSQYLPYCLLTVALAAVIRLLISKINNKIKSHSPPKNRLRKLLILIILISMACPTSASQQEVELMQVNLRNIWAPQAFQHPPVLTRTGQKIDGKKDMPCTTILKTTQN